MIHFTLFTTAVLLNSVIAQNLHDETTNCALIGPQFPKPPSLHQLSDIGRTSSSFAKLLADTIESGLSAWGEIDRAETTFSVGVFTTTTEEFIFEHHHRGDRLDETLTGKVLDRDTLYRIGSVSKLFTIYTILARLGDKYWDEPITKYVPELRQSGSTGDNAVRDIDWSEVTLGALASHSAGIPRDDGFIDLYNIDSLRDLGLPKLKTPPKCGGASQPGCPREEAIELILQQLPVTSTFSSPVYSNEGFQLLGFAVENVTGEPFADTFRNAIVEPLGLSRTFWSPPPEDDNAINVTLDDPLTGYSFNHDLGTYNPTGGVAASLGDLSAIGRSILRSQLLPKTTTRKWLKPDANTGSLYSAIGKPWEITRMEVPLQSGHKQLGSSTNTRLVDLYTKNGGVGAYESYIIVSPDHNLGISILLASNLTRESGRAGLTMKTISDMTTSVWVTAAESAAREQAEKHFAGVYIAKYTDEYDMSGLAARVELAMLPGRQGLAVISTTYNGTDVLSMLGKMAGFVGADLHYTGLSSHNEVSFRAIWSHPLPKTVGEEEQVSNEQSGFAYPKKVLNRPCASTWGGIDLLNYGNYGLDHFVFATDDHGDALRLRLPALRITLTRQRESSFSAVDDDVAYDDKMRYQQPM